MNFGVLGVERSPSLTEQVAKRIAAAIDDGSFLPGERLVESRLAEVLGVSRGPVREALKVLESENVVRISPGRGTFVAAPSEEDIEQMIPAWALLEGLAARIAVAGSEKSTVNRLNLLTRNLRDAAGRREAANCLELYWGFHEQLCSLTGNPSVIRNWQSMRGQLRLFWRARANDMAEIEKLVRETQLLAEGLGGGDPDAADALFRSHTVLAGYRVLGRPVPDWLRDYVTPAAAPGHGLQRRREVAAYSVQGLPG